MRNSENKKNNYFKGEKLKMAKLSENSVKVIEYLKENHGKKMTSQDVAAALDMSTATVNGVFTSLSNKKLGVRESATVKGAIDATFIGIVDADRPEGLSENAIAILDYLATVKGKDITTDDAVEATGIEKRKFTGTFNSLVKKGLAERIPVKVEGDVPVKYLVLTEAGLAFDPTASDAE